MAVTSAQKQTRLARLTLKQSAGNTKARDKEREEERLTISLILRLHVHERVKVDVAVEVNVWLDAPVPAVLLEEFVFEEELFRLRSKCQFAGKEKMGEGHGGEEVERERHIRPS